MEILAMIYLFSLVISLSVFAAQPSIDKDAYNLHQALNLMSVYAMGKCDKALPVAQIHLSEITEKFNDKPFGSIVAELRKIKNPSQTNIVDLEKLRMKYSEVLEKNSIEHKMVWHREIESLCPYAPHVE